MRKPSGKCYQAASVDGILPTPSCLRRILSHRIPLRELRQDIWLLLGICLSYDVLGKYKDVIGLERVFYSGSTAGLQGLRATW